MSMTLVSAYEAGRIGTRNRKMPGTSYALPTWECGIGKKLSYVEGSVGFDCYAKDSERMYPSVRQGRSSNFARGTAMVESDPERFARFMAFQVEHFANKFREPYHRWFDAGDIP